MIASPHRRLEKNLHDTVLLSMWSRRPRDPRTISYVVSLVVFGHEAMSVSATSVRTSRWRNCDMNFERPPKVCVKESLPGMLMLLTELMSEQSGQRHIDSEQREEDLATFRKEFVKRILAVRRLKQKEKADKVNEQTTTGGGGTDGAEGADDPAKAGMPARAGGRRWMISSPGDGRNGVSSPMRFYPDIPIRGDALLPEEQTAMPKKDSPMFYPEGGQGDGGGAALDNNAEGVALAAGGTSKAPAETDEDDVDVHMVALELVGIAKKAMTRNGKIKTPEQHAHFAAAAALIEDDLERFSGTAVNVDDFTQHLAEDCCDNIFAVVLWGGGPLKDLRMIKARKNLSSKDKSLIDEYAQKFGEFLKNNDAVFGDIRAFLARQRVKAREGYVKACETIQNDLEIVNQAERDAELEKAEDLLYGAQTEALTHFLKSAKDTYADVIDRGIRLLEEDYLARFPIFHIMQGVKDGWEAGHTDLGGQINIRSTRAETAHTVEVMDVDDDTKGASAPARVLSRRITQLIDMIAEHLHSSFQYALETARRNELVAHDQLLAKIAELTGKGQEITEADFNTPEFLELRAKVLDETSLTWKFEVEHLKKLQTPARRADRDDIDQA